MHRTKINPWWYLAAVPVGIAAAMLWPSKEEAPTQLPPVYVTIQPMVPEKQGVSYYIIENGQTVPPALKDANRDTTFEVHVANTSPSECQQMGGTYQAHNRICLNVDR